MEDSNAINSEHNRLVNRQETTHHGLLNPRGPYLKWIAVFFMCFLSFGKTILFLMEIYLFILF